MIRPRPDSSATTPAAEAQSDEAHDAGQTPTERAFQELQTARRQGSGAVVALIRVVPVRVPVGITMSVRV